MQSNGALWVLGHRIRPLETDESYGMVEVTSPPNVPGPPPHYHKGEREFFFVVTGTLDVMTNGRWSRVSAGTFLELPPDTVHTFVNKTGEDVVWVTGWRPKGFQRFFADFGVPTGEPDAQRRSTADELIGKLVQRVESYGMYLAT
jgi:quercetin dioxygenase-like cupin family protein